jgi:hypothetical protein
MGLLLLQLLLPLPKLCHEAGHRATQLHQLRLQGSAVLAAVRCCRRQLLQHLAAVGLLLKQQRDVTADDGAHAAAMVLKTADAAEQLLLLRILGRCCRGCVRMLGGCGCACQVLVIHACGLL